MFGLHNNRIGDTIGNYCNLSTGFNLQIFGTSFNKIKELREDTLLSGLKNIYLNNKPQFNNSRSSTGLNNLLLPNIAHNKTNDIDQDAFKNLRNLRALRLDNNELKDINSLVSSQRTSSG